MPKFTIVRRTVETVQIVVEADTEEQVEARDLDGAYDSLWENGDQDDFTETDVWETEDDVELTKPCLDKPAPDLFGRKG